MRRLCTWGAALVVLMAPALGLADYPEECVGNSAPSASDCDQIGDVGLIGCCDDLGRTVWCDDGELYCIDCALESPICGWDESSDW